MNTIKTPITVTADIDNNERTVDIVDNTSKDDNVNSALIEGFRRMETAVVELRSDLIRKVDQSVEKKENKQLDDISKKLDKLDSLLVENKNEMADINKKLSVLADKSLVNLEPASVQAVAAAVSDISNTKEIELEKIANAVNEVKEKLDSSNIEDVVDTSRKVLEELKSVKDLSDTFSNGLDKLDNLFENNVLKEVAMNSEKSVSALNSLNNNMEKFLAKIDVKINTAGVVKEPETKEKIKILQQKLRKEKAKYSLAL